MKSAQNDQISVEIFDSVTVFSLTGQFLGGEESDELRSLLIANNTPSRNAILDMQGVTFVNSSFLGTLLAMHTAFQRAGFTLAIVGLRKTVRQIFTLTRLDTALNVFETMDEAVEKLTPNLN